MNYKEKIEAIDKKLEEGTITIEKASKQKRVYEFLSECDEDDIECIFHTGAFNEITRGYFYTALKLADISELDISNVIMSYRMSFDFVAAERER